MDKPIFLEPPNKSSLTSFCRLLYERHLVSGVGGNVSAKEGNTFLVTPSGISLRDITPEAIVTAQHDGRVRSGAIPSKEFNMHRHIFETRNDIRIVCHVHGSYIIAASTILDAGPNSLPPLTPGFAFLAYPLPLLPFLIPGSKELTEAVGQYFSNKRLKALLLKNHGLITIGYNMAEALNIAEEVDEAARIYVLTSGKGSQIDKDSVSKIC